MNRVFQTFPILHFLLLLFSISVFPQQEKLQTENFTIDNGLSQNSINCIVQDNVGFIWIGTQNGLNRYDGYTFTKYNFNPEDKTSLSHNYINFILEDNSNQLWIGTAGGLNKYNRQLDSFTRYVSDPDNPNSLNSNLVMSIYEDSKDILWIGTDGGGLNKLNRNTNSFSAYTHNPEDSTTISSDRIFYAICEDKQGNLLIGTLGGGLNLFNRQTQQFTHYINNPNDSTSLSNDRIYTIYVDKSGNVWIGTDGGGLNKLISQKNDFEPPTFIRYNSIPNDNSSINGNRVYSILEDTEGNILVGTLDGGLNKYVRNQNCFIQYDIPLVQTIYKDRTDLIWIGTFGEGVYKLDTKKQPFKHYKNNPNDPLSLSNNSIWSFFEFNEKVIWVGTRDGLNIFKRENKDFIHFRNDVQNPSSLSDNTIYKIYKDRRGDMWIGTNNGLNKVIIDEKNSLPTSFVRYRHDPENQFSICGNVITYLYEDELGKLWIGTEDGGISILRRGESGDFLPNFLHYKHNTNDNTSISTNRVFFIYGDSYNQTWVGTNNGLDLYDRKNDEFIHFKHDSGNLNSLNDNWIMSIYEDKLGVLWVGTFMGLNKFDKIQKNFKRYSVTNGLPDNMIYAIVEDDNGNLWMSTNNGLSMFNTKTEIFKNYDVKDGLQSNEFNQYAGLKSSNGEMFFGGVNGFNIFHPDSLKGVNTHLPEIVITNFLINNKKVKIGFDSTFNRNILYKSITGTKEIELLYNDEAISFEFSALEFTAPEKNQYAYMMVGFDKKWNFTDASRRYVTYTNLDPGEYNFRVKGSNNDGYWNEEGASIRIIILPPWWATTWAYIIYALIILSIIYFTWKMQLKRIRIKHDYEMSKFEAEKMHEVDEMKSRFFANISHEFRTPLTLIFGPAKDVLEKTEDPYTKKNVGIIKRNASKLYGLVNQLLDLSKLEAGKMKLEASEQNIIPLLKGYVLSFSSLAERKKITLSFNTIEENFNVFIDKEKVERIINNLLSNAFKFTTEGGKIDFTVEKLIKDAEIRIADNGIGIAKERIDKIFDRFYQVDGSHTRESEGTGIGLALTKELVELHKGKIMVESNEGEGTTFRVLLPLSKEHLKPEEIVDKEICEELPEIKGETELVPEMENRKEKTEIDVLLETDKPLLLIVEDNSDVRKYIISHLDEDYRIQEAIDGKDGLEQALKHIPDLIISDVMMPKMDGFELCNKLKTDEKTSHIPIIMLTAKATSQDKIEGYETGADDYIMKPFNATELKVRIKNLIEIRRKLQEKFSSDDYSIPKELSSIDEQFIKRVLQVINEHISEEKFSIEQLCSEVGMSDVQIYRKIKSLTGKSPSSFIRSLRLSKAKKMLEEKRGNIAEIAYSVGFGSPSYFTRSFKEEYGHPPSDLKS